MSWESTAFYYKLINQAVREELGNLNSAKILLFSLNYEPIVDIADAAGNLLLSTNIQKIGLLGTAFTMEDGFYSSRLENKFGLEVIVPNLGDRR